MRNFFFNTLWDAFLAAIPVVLGYAAAAQGASAARRRNPLPWVLLGVLLLVWLAFLPNASYVITQWRHLLEKVDQNNLTLQAQNDRQAMFAICTRALFYFCYSGFGVLALTLAIRPVERLLRSWRLPFLYLAPMLFALLSLGVYLGLIVRWNSWDLLLRPRAVAISVLDVISRPKLMLAIAVFALLLWGLYEAMDIWVEGVKQRLQARLPNRQWLDDL